MNLDQIRIVLVRTFHAGNIGSAARSMKTMGLSDLYLVAPKDFPSPEANKMAAGAESMIENITVVDSLAEAVADCRLIIATSVRPRGYDLPSLSPEQAATQLVEQSRAAPVALVFGPERMGLHNQDLQFAKYRVAIPANPEYSSLNLAAAVQTLSYEIYKASLAAAEGDVQSNKPTSTDIQESEEQLPTGEEIEMLHRHLQQVLTEIQFLRPHQGETLQRLRNLVARAQPNQLEYNILRGILTAMQKSLQNARQSSID